MRARRHTIHCEHSRVSGPAVWGFAACVALHASAGTAQTVEDASLEVETVATGLFQPTTMGFLGTDDILVLEKATGIVQRIHQGIADPVLDVAVHYRSERGLLGIAVDSGQPPRVFLYYTESSTGDDTNSSESVPAGNRVYRYDWNPSTEALVNPQLILDLPATPGPNHDGGIALLGPTGEGSVGDGSLLYAVIGDLNRNGQLENFPFDAAPDDTAVVLRVEQDGSPAPGNPFSPYCSSSTGTTCTDDLDCPETETCVTKVARYFAYGIRNSFGMALDPVTGSLWDTENGPGSYDEINHLAPGANSGWEAIMGPDSRDSQDPGDLFDVPGAGSTYSDPEFSWFDTVAPTAIVFPVGSGLGPAYDDVTLVGDNNTGQIYTLPLNTQRNAFDFSDPSLASLQDLVADDQAEANLLLFGSGFGVVTDLEIGPDGDLYVVSLSQGAIYRVSGPAPTPTPSPLTKAQQACVNEMNKNGEKVNKAQLKENERCLKDFQTEKLAPMTLDECMAADRKGKLQKKEVKTADKEGKKCDPLAVPPPFAYADSAAVNAGAIDGALALTYKILGAPPVLDADLFTKADDPEAAKCQLEMLKRTGKLENTVLKELIKAKKLALKDETITSGAALEAKLEAVFSSNVKIEKTRFKLLTGADKKCAAVQVPPGEIFAGDCGEGDPTLRRVELCAIVAAKCAACAKINAFDDLNLDCDQLDDQAANGSCPALR